MKKFKKLVSFVLAGTMALAMSVSAFAATAGITADEQRILDQAEAKAIELGVDVKTSQTYKDYVSQATTYLAKNDLNSEQVNAMVKAVDEAATTAQADMKAKGVSKLTELNKDDITALFNKVEGEVTKAANAVGIVITRDADGTFSVKDLPKEGSEDKKTDDNKSDTYLQTTTVIKQTGTDLAADKVGASVSVDTAATDMTTTVILGVMFVGAVAVCGVVAKRKNLFSGVEA